MVPSADWLRGAPETIAAKSPRRYQVTSNTWGALCHLCGLAGYLGNGIGSVIAPLIIWLIKKDESPAVDYHGKEALNFNISVMIYGFALGGITVLTAGLAMFVTIPLLVILAIFHFVCVIYAAVKASDGKPYRYPLCIRLIS